MWWFIIVGNTCFWHQPNHIEYIKQQNIIKTALADDIVLNLHICYWEFLYSQISAGNKLNLSNLHVRQCTRTMGYLLFTLVLCKNFQGYSHPVNKTGLGLKIPIGNHL